MRTRLSLLAISFAASLAAVPLFSAAPALTRLADPSTESYAINNLGFVHAPRSEVENALRFFAASLAAKRSDGDLNGEASALHSLGVIYESRGENREALDYLQQSLSIYRRLANRREEAIVLDNLGVVHSRLAETKSAIADFEQSLALFRQLGIREFEASTLNNLGQANLTAGDRQAALSHLLQSLKIRRAIGDRRGEAQTLNNLGALYDLIGEPSQALAYFTAALNVRRRVGDHYGEAHVLNNIGVVQMSLGRAIEASRRFKETLELLRASGDRFGEAGALNNLGVALAATGHPRPALENYAASLTLRRSIGDPRGESLTLDNIALTHLELGAIEEAVCELHESLSVSREIDDLRGQAVALHALADVERQQGHLLAALALIAEGAEIIESMGDKILSDDLRISFSASEHDVQQLFITILMQLHRRDRTRRYDLMALEVSERFRAPALLGALTDATQARWHKADAELVERELTLRRRVGAAATSYMHLLAAAAGKEELDAAHAELLREKTEYAAVEGEIKKQSAPDFWTSQPPLTADEIRSTIVDRDSAVIEYFLGEQQSYLWLITSEAVCTFELPSRARIEAAARRMYALLTARNAHVRFETAEEKVARVAAADADYWPAASRLSAMLIGPIAAKIGGKRLLVVPDGVLFNVPFSALPDPRAGSGGVPLVVDHEIIVLPSASTLARLRSEIAGRAPGRKLVAVIADPVYSKEESSTFPRLRFAREEASGILELVPRAAGRGALGFQASRTRVLRDDLRDYRYIHFATHAYVDDTNPELSAMVLSLIDEQGRTQDGFLRLSDVIHLKLSAEMVVLSGCRTGLGRQVGSEGVIGLARGFFYAGAARVVVSLWDVNDRATAELMKEFYRPILGKQRLSPATALRAAQISMWKQSRWRAPYYWASFVISGEPR
ncbi:MAG TPA: CHAT domain-containing tetratricopeptide repeat protein [Thermoanaerobaculia bacterium]|nr:CHAT domain-containing tetratricopeptide repeat protein [Thermoanaerobaculia bacterium]